MNRTIALSITLLLALLSTASADKVVLVAGGGDGADGSAAAEAKLVVPFGVEHGPDGNLYIVEYTGNRVRKIDAKTGVLTTVAGTGKKGAEGDGGPAPAGQLNVPHCIAISPSGDIYVADTGNYRVRKIDGKTGVLSTFAGTGEKGFSGDGGPAKDAKFSGIYSVALDPKGERMVVADLDNRRIRAIDMTSGVVTTVAGNGEKGKPADGAEAAKSPLVDPRAAAIDAAGNVYVLERGGHALRIVDASGKIRTVVGTGQKGHSGDGGPALAATINGPKHLWIEADANVLIADTENHAIRRYNPKDGTITAVAGTGKVGNAGLGGPPDKVQLKQPHGVYVDKQGTLYIADSHNGRVLRIEK